MFTAEDTLDRTRPILRALVERERRLVGSVLTAYETLGRRIGASADMVRRIVGRHRKVNLGGHHLLNILALYRRACERQEAEAEIERVKLLALQERANEVFEVLGFEVESARSARSSLTEAPSRHQ